MHLIGNAFDELLKLGIKSEPDTLRVNAKFTHDSELCVKILEKNSFTHIARFCVDKKRSDLNNYTPKKIHAALNAALGEFYRLVNECLTDSDFVEPENLHLSFQQALLCLFSAHLGNHKNLEQLTLSDIREKNVLTKATDLGWLTLAPSTSQSKPSIVQGLVILYTKYLHDFNNLPKETEQRMLTALLSSTNIVKGASEAFSPKVDLPSFSERIILSILTFCTKEEAGVLLPTVKKLSDLNRGSAAANLACCCVSDKFRDDFTHADPTPTLYERYQKRQITYSFVLLAAIGSNLLISAGMVCFVMYKSCNLSLKMAGLYFGVFSAVAVTTQLLFFYLIYRVIKHDFEGFAQKASLSEQVTPTMAAPIPAPTADGYRVELAP